MPKTRRSYAPSLKAKVAVEAIKAQRSTAEIAKIYSVHPNLIGLWKRQALAGLPEVFTNGRDRQAGLETLYPKRNLSRPAPGHEIYPYLLRGVPIERVHQVWSSDITYVPLRHGFLYLTAVMDGHSRCVLSWELSHTLDGWFCRAALEAAFQWGQPEIFNTDQGAQFTAREYLQLLKDRHISDAPIRQWRAASFRNPG